MAYIDGSYYLDWLSIPGSHDAGSWYQKNDWAFCQGWGFNEQLAAGVRFFDWRLRNTDDGIHIYHGSTDMGIRWRDIANDAAYFLYSHWDEALIFSITCEGGNDCNTLYQRFYEETYDYLWSSQLFEQNRTPRLDEVRGKIVMVSRMQGVRGLKWQQPDSVFAISDMYWTCDNAKRNEITDHLYAVENRGPDYFWYITFISCSGGGIPMYWAEYYNDLVLGYIRSENEDNRNWGTVLMDFGGNHLIGAIVRSNNGKRVSNWWDLQQEKEKAMYQKAKTMDSKKIGLILGLTLGGVALLVGIIVVVKKIRASRITPEELYQDLNQPEAVQTE
jgi:1-phosphatidylinositol phosphodiesterase